MTSKKGIIISFEGIDASGKNTQSTMLYEYLRNRKVQTDLLSFPNYSTRIGQEIRNFLSGRRNYGTEARHLLYAANRYESKSLIERWIADEKIIVVNRYSESNLAYGVANGLPLDWLGQVESQMPRANYIIYLKIDPMVSTSRKLNRDKYEADQKFLKRVSDVYDAIAQPGRWFVIDGDRSKDLIHYEIIKTLSALLPERDITEEEKIRPT